MYNASPYIEFPTGPYLLPPMGMRITGLGHLLCNPMAGIPDRVWSLSSQPCLGLWVGLAGGSCCWNFGPCSAWWSRAALRAFGRWGWLPVKLGVFFHSGAAPSAKKWVRSAGRSSSASNSSASNQTCFLSFSSFCGEASHHCTLSFESLDLCCDLRLSMEWCSHSSGWDCGGLVEGGWHWLGHDGEGLSNLLNPFLSLEWVLLSYNQDCLSCSFASRVCFSSSRPQDCL